MSMFIILPNKRTGLPRLEEQLKDVDLKNLTAKMHRSEVEVSIPKFKIEFEVSLVDALKKVIEMQFHTSMSPLPTPFPSSLG